MTEQVWWYATRAAGLMTWSTAVASVIIGMLLSTRLLGRRASASWLLDVHRFLGGLSAVFLIVHMVTLWADSFVDFGWEELLIPGRSSFDNVAVAWGVGAMWSLIAVEITSILRRWISHSLWKRTHYLSIVTVGAGSVHGYQLGSDVDNPLAWGGALAASGVVIILSLFRLRKKPSQRLVTERASVLLEMRERLAELPVPESMPQPTLETSEIEGEAILPRRAPVRKGPELPPPPMPDLEIDDRLTELALDDFDSAEQINTLLDQFRNLPTPGEIENDPAVPPSAPSGLDRPPEFSRSSDEQPLPPPAPVEDAEPLSSHPFDDLVAMGDTRTAPQPPPPPGLETPDSEDDDRPRAGLRADSIRGARVWCRAC